MAERTTPGTDYPAPVSLSRRRLLFAASGMAGTAILAACGDEAAITPTTAAPTARPATMAAVAPTTAAPAAAMTTPPPPTAPATVAATTTAPITGVAATVAPTVAPIAASAASAASTAVPAAPTAAATAASAAAPSATTATAAMTAAAPMDGRISSGNPSVPDAWTKFPPVYRTVPTVPGRGGKVSIFQITFNPPVAPRNENMYWREREKRLGVSELEMQFVPSDTYREKIAALTAGGDLPDLVYVDTTAAPDQLRAIQQGAYLDLTPYLTGPALQEFPNLANLPPYLWQRTAVRGKTYGVPRSWFIAPNPLLIRQDWAEKVGIPAPKNADEFLALMTAFTKMDPDGNGRADTWGIGPTSAPAGNFGLAFFQQMFRVPNQWRKNPDGTLTNAIETEEFRQTLAFMRRMFEAGVYHPDAATMTNAQSSDAFTAGRTGAVFGGRLSLPGGNGQRFFAQQQNPAAKVAGYVPVGFDGGKPLVHNDRGYQAIVAIPANRGRDRERVKELLRILDLYAAPFGSEEHVFSFFGFEGVHSMLQPDGLRLRTEGFRKEILDFPNLVTYPQVYSYDRPGDAAEMQGYAKAMIADGVDNPTLGLYSQLNTMRAGELQQLGNDRVNAIIAGREPLSSLDQYVRDWRSRGGDTIRREYEAELKAQ